MKTKALPSGEDLNKWVMSQVIEALSDLSGIDANKITNDQRKRDQDLELDLGLNRFYKRSLKGYFDNILEEMGSSEVIQASQCETLETINDCTNLLMAKA